MKEKEMVKVAKWINEVVEQVKDERLPKEKKARNEFAKQFKKRISQDKWLKQKREEIAEFARQYPVPGV
jgi:glycine/serine hydroxymethyltransferase